MLFSASLVISNAQEKDYAIRAVPFTKVNLTDKFWQPKIETNRIVTIPSSFVRCESTGRVENFIKAANRTGMFGTKFPFDDTDIYKTLEGAAFSLAVYPDKKLDAYLDSLITIIGNAQEADGYLYTPRTIDPNKPHPWAGNRRWVLEHENSHELYNSGHLFEAAAAHYLATGKSSLLNIALKNADLLVQTFGPNKLHVAPGHEIVEMGLVRLYRITGKEEYLNLAKFFIDERGKRKYETNSQDPYKNGQYWQDAQPITAETEAVGHAVRAMYLYAAVADIAALTKDDKYLSAIDTIWSNMVNKKIYVQGGIGAIGNGERFGNNYELPNATAYNETCAAIGNVFWNQRMFQLHGDAKYVDLLEHILYNGLISGVGLDGKSFFYTNAMEINLQHKHGEANRSGWFECSCCPTNLARFLPSLPGYMYAVNKNSVFVNLYISGSADIQLEQGDIKIIQQNNYPWDGGLIFNINPKSSSDFEIKFRIPGWARSQVMPSTLYTYTAPTQQDVHIKINGKNVPFKIEKGYATLARTWKKGDQVEIALPMEIKQIHADNNVKDDIGKVAIQRGPLIYCAEAIDNGGSIEQIAISPTTQLKPVFAPDILNGVTLLKGDLPKGPFNGNKETSTEKNTFTAIPYYAWANRNKGDMKVWFPQEIKAPDLGKKNGE